MIRTRTLLNPRRVAQFRLLRVASIWLCSGILVLNALQFARLALLDASITKELRSGTSALSKLEKKMAGQPKLAPAVVPEKPLSRFRADLGSVAKSQGCAISEFQVDAERAPFLSVFTLNGETPGWQQMTVHLTLRGTFPSILKTLESMGKSSVPVELNSVELTRQAVTEAGGSDIVLRVECRVLIPEGART